MPKYTNFQNGIAVSKEVQNAWDDLVNVDIHSEPGIAKPQKAIAKASGSIADKGYYRALAPNGDTYFFSKTDGTIIKRTSAGVYSTVRTNSNGAHKSAIYYRNYIYYTTDTKLGRYAFGDIDLGNPTMTIASPCVVTLADHGLVLGEIVYFTTTGALPTGLTASTNYYVIPIDDDTFSLATSYANAVGGTKIDTTGTQSGTHSIFRYSWNDNYQLLTTGKPHPMEQFDLILYIGDGSNIAQLDDAGVFTSQALDLPVEHNIKALKSYGDDLLTLSSPGDYLNDSAIFRWDTYSDSWTIKDAIKEVDVYAFLEADNVIFAVALSGNIYVYNGSQLELFSTIRNAKSTSGHQLTTNLKGKPLVANGGRIYSLHRANRNFPIVLCGEYTCSAGENATIHSIQAVGSQLVVSWEYSGTFGCDEISANYADAQLITPRADTPLECRVPFVELPTGTSIEIETKGDGETSWTEQEVITDTEDEREVFVDDYLDFKSGAQAKIILNSNGTSCPSINQVNLT